MVGSGLSWLGMLLWATNYCKVAWWNGAALAACIVAWYALMLTVGVGGGMVLAAGVPSCLPADALVQMLSSGTALPVTVPIESVPHGASILTSGGFSPVYLYSHHDGIASSIMRRLETASGHAAELSMQHYIRVDGLHTMARNVAKGMHVDVRYDNGSMIPSEVIRTSDVTKRGLFNPFTVEGDVVVLSSNASSDGIVASDQSEWFAEGYMAEHQIPSLYHRILAPVRLLFAANPAWVTRFHDHTKALLEAPHAEGKPAMALDELGVFGILKAAHQTSPLSA